MGSHLFFPLLFTGKYSPLPFCVQNGGKNWHLLLPVCFLSDACMWIREEIQTAQKTVGVKQVRLDATHLLLASPPPSHIHSPPLWHQVAPCPPVARWLEPMGATGRRSEESIGVCLGYPSSEFASDGPCPSTTDHQSSQDLLLYVISLLQRAGNHSFPLSRRNGHSFIPSLPW